MSLYDVWGAPTETDCQVINKESFEDVHDNTNSLIFSPKHVIAKAPPVGILSFGGNSSESVVPTLTGIRWSLEIF